ncbi:unnamed protein product, partial [Amoebophrya sp. A25]
QLLAPINTNASNNVEQSVSRGASAVDVGTRSGFKDSNALVESLVSSGLGQHASLTPVIEEPEGGSSRGGTPRSPTGSLTMAARIQAHVEAMMRESRENDGPPAVQIRTLHDSAKGPSERAGGPADSAKPSKLQKGSSGWSSSLFPSVLDDLGEEESSAVATVKRAV